MWSGERTLVLTVVPPESALSPAVGTYLDELIRRDLLFVVDTGDELMFSLRQLEGPILELAGVGLDLALELTAPDGRAASLRSTLDPLDPEQSWNPYSTEEFSEEDLKPSAGCSLRVKGELGMVPNWPGVYRYYAGEFEMPLSEVVRLR